MRVAQVCLIVAVVLAFLAAGVVVAQTIYPGECCTGTPVPPCSNDCGRCRSVGR